MTREDFVAISKYILSNEGYKDGVYTETFNPKRKKAERLRYLVKYRKDKK